MGMMYHRHLTAKDEAKKPRPEPEVTEKAATQPKKRSTKKPKGE